MVRSQGRDSGRWSGVRGREGIEERGGVGKWKLTSEIVGETLLAPEEVLVEIL